MDAAQRTRRAGPRPWNGDAIQAAFEAAAQTRPWTAGYRSMASERLSSDAVVSGRLPEGLRGTLFRNGPARHELGGQRYGHRWDGDGMLQRFQFSDSGVSHVGQYIRTRKYLAESEAGRLLVSGFGTHVPDSDSNPERIDEANPANISVVPFGGELLALWEAGSAHRLDPATLETRGVKVWSESLAGRPFSAHPRIESNGSLWNFGVDPLNDELTLYHAAPNGNLTRSHVMKVEQLSPTHDFAVTERHLIFLLPSITLDKERLNSGVSFAEACQWSPSLGMRVLVIDKNDWSHRFFELPPGCLFHIANAWEDEADVIRLHYMRSPDPRSFLAGWTVMRGEYRHHEGARLTELRIDPNSGSAEQTTVVDRDSEFPVVAAARVGHRHDHVLCVERGTRKPDVPGFDQVALVDVNTGKSSRFEYGDNYLVEEHLLVAADRKSLPKWVVGTALDVVKDNTVVSVFDAFHLYAGPIAQARLPYSLPLGLHGCFENSQTE